MRFPGAWVLLVLFLFALVVFLPGSARAGLQPAAADPSSVAAGAGVEKGHCLVGTVRGEDTHLFCTAAVKRALFAVTSGFRKTKVHARRLSAQCRFPGIARVAGVSCFEGSAAMALLPLAEGLHQDKKPQGTRAPPLKNTALVSCCRG